jgi:thioredoxin-related protein
MSLLKFIFSALLFTGTNLFLSSQAFAQIKNVQFEQLDSLQKTEKRPVIVFLHTSWCKYCGTMKNTTFKNDEVIKALNQNFYFVSLDIEEKRDITFRGYAFKFKPTGTNTGEHELAEKLGTINGQLAYPGICFLNTDFEIIYQHGGYASARQIINLLQVALK